MTLIALENGIQNVCDLKSLVIPSDKFDEGKIIFLDEQSLYEAKLFSPKYGAWLLSDKLHNSGELYMLTKFDPVYLLLIVLDHTVDGGNLYILDDILTNEKYPALKLVKFLFNTDLVSRVCIWKECGDDLACRLDPTKALAFLSSRFEQVVKCLRENSKQSMLFADMSQIKLHAFDIVADNVGPKLRKQLKSHLNIEDKNTGDQAALIAKENIQQVAKKSKIDKSENEDVVEDYTKCGVPITKMSANSSNAASKKGKTKLKKVTGQQSVSSFFKK